MGTIVDLHTHVTDHWDIIRRNGKKFFGLFNNPTEIPKEILLRCSELQNSLGSSTLAAIVNFDDNRAGGLFDEIERFAESAKIDAKRKSGVLAVRFGSSTSYFIQGREIRTTKGDVLIVGNGRDFPSREPEYIFKAARGDGDSLVLIPHLGVPVIGMNLTTADKYREFIDAVDGREYADTLKVPSFTASDSHTIKHMFSKAQIFSNFNLDSPVVSLRDALKNYNKPYQCKPKQGIYEMGRHLVSSCLYTPFMLKRGILRRG